MGDTLLAPLSIIEYGRGAKRLNKEGQKTTDIAYKAGPNKLELIDQKLSILTLTLSKRDPNLKFKALRKMPCAIGTNQKHREAVQLVCGLFNIEAFRTLYSNLPAKLQHPKLNDIARNRPRAA